MVYNFYMRLRNIKNAEQLIYDSKMVVIEPFSFCGNWKSIFNNSNPIEIEIGMGKGNFIISKALNNPNINYIGIEKYATVLLIAIRKLNIYLPNLKFICADATNIDKIFKNEVHKIYLNFSDPWSKARHEKRRLTHENFLIKYDCIFHNKKCIEMKTDNIELFDYSLDSFQQYGYTIKKVSRNYKSRYKTEYEFKFLKKDKTINHVIVVK